MDIEESGAMSPFLRALEASGWPQRAVILAAGPGIRMAPIGHETPKAMLMANGERLIERQIRQLHEDLRALDAGPEHLQSEVLSIIAEKLGSTPEQITEISVLKKGMTNRSFLFSCEGRRFIMRVPGEGTSRLIDRDQEAEVYRAIRGQGFCDDPILLDPRRGYKLSAYIVGSHCCDPRNEAEVARCMAILRSLHERKLKVGHRFDLYERIDAYKRLCDPADLVYSDLETIHRSVLSLKPYVDAQEPEEVLCHIDPVADNFIFCGRHGADGEEVQLIDWEYSGMQDPHVDLAMFAVYALYDREQIDHLMELYFGGACPQQTRLKIYCYVAACGLLWVYWYAYKRSQGVEFGDIGLRQYLYARDYAWLVHDELDQQGSREIEEWIG